ncbi:hypothetical protein RFI_22258 [Reticulomyxa filosa]|uniref:Uncharacterized protein n=1 Tax=Reticulomyxa filosa TaxID=46433 RepID=X6MML4_RETFI|nr:hypothetical protein RFI_22258 [Reticulomyxa filosa]|eukprot:ETO15104.1 hypothetical protein RFI_22258 [Reticulomyxa filosa]
MKLSHFEENVKDWVMVVQVVSETRKSKHQQLGLFVSQTKEKTKTRKKMNNKKKGGERDKKGHKSGNYVTVKTWTKLWTNSNHNKKKKKGGV